MTNAMREIKTKEQFRGLLDNYMRKEQINIPSVEVDLVKGRYTCDFEITATPLSRIYVKDNVVESVQIRNGSRVVTINNKYTWNFLSVAVTNEAAVRADEIFGSNIYLIHSSNGWVRVLSDLGSSNALFVDLNTGENFSTLPKGVAHIYRGLTWTASNKRQKTMMFMEVTTNDIRFEVLDNATLGAVTKLYNQYGLDNSKNTFMSLQKAGGYVGNVLTGSVDFGRVTGYVRYYAKWENNTNETFLSDSHDAARNEYMKALRTKDIEAIRAAKATLDAIIKDRKMLTDIPTQDGQMYINVRVFAKMLEVKFNIKVDTKALLGMMIQLRPGTIKASAVVVSEEVFLAIVEGTKVMADAKGQKVETIGDVNNLLYIADKNCIKLDYDLEKEITMQILAFAKCSQGKTSKQLAETILYAANGLGENGAQLLYDILKLSLDTKVASLTVDKKARLLTPEEIESGVNSRYVNDIVLSIAPKFIDENRAFFNSTWRQAINAITNMIDGLNGAIASHNRRLSSDPVFILTGGKLEGLLNTGEVFINNRKISKVVMIKYPKMGLREYYFAKNVNLKAIKKRVQFHVNKGTITQAEADSVFKFYSQLDSFVAVLPAKSVIAYACAGLDFDYDGALFLEHSSNPKDEKEELTNKLVDLLERTRMKAVVIQN